jgi:hypothetical protein
LAIEEGAIYAKCEDREMQSAILPAEPYFTELERFLAAFRLFKGGWIMASVIWPTTKIGAIELEANIDYPPNEQLWADPLSYTVERREISQIRRIYKQLSIIPTGYIDIALRRFNRSYEYWRKDSLDDCFVDLVIALESITSKGGDGVKQAVVLRTCLLLASKYEEREGKKNK